MCGASPPPLPDQPPPPLPDPEQGALGLAPNPVSQPNPFQAALTQTALSSLQIPLRK